MAQRDYMRWHSATYATARRDNATAPRDNATVRRDHATARRGNATERRDMTMRRVRRDYATARLDATARFDIAPLTAHAWEIQARMPHALCNLAEMEFHMNQT